MRQNDGAQSERGGGMKTTIKLVRRETLSSAREQGKTRALVVELNTTYMRIKLKGMRTWYTVTYDQVRTIGARNAVEARKQERKNKKEKTLELAQAMTKHVSALETKKGTV